MGDRRLDDSRLTKYAVRLESRDVIKLAGLSYINDTHWRYVNFGTADTLIVTGTTLKNLSSDKSATGTAFYQTA
ncbi:MAG: hypothetical protein II973_08810, partial [Spirochaetaceae bacterium]|nr:hypothetical protein [Spirochaetaceae bacterium]